MCAEMTATMLVWPRRCGHGGMVLELVEGHRPYWLGRRGGRRVSRRIPEWGSALSSGLDLAQPGRRDWAGRSITLVRYAGCFLTDTEIDLARTAGLHIDVVDLGGQTQEKRSA